jgi:hypothetical protein
MDQQSESDLSKLPLASFDSPSNHFFIEVSPFPQCVTSIVLLLVILLIFATASILAPSYFTSFESIHSPEDLCTSASIHLPFTVTGLTPRPRVISLSGSLIASAPLSKQLVLEIQVKHGFFYGAELHRRSKSPRLDRSVVFHPNSLTSSEVSLLVVRPASIQLPSIDWMSVELALTANFTSISGVKLAWHIHNPSSEPYFIWLRILASCFDLYAVCVFLLHIRFTPDDFTQVLIAILALLGVLATNPAHLFAPAKFTDGLADHILMGLFVFAYRVFLILELEMLLERSTFPNQWLLAVVTALCGI